jgi:hypothetical protein
VITLKKTTQQFIYLLLLAIPLGSFAQSNDDAIKTEEQRLDSITRPGPLYFREHQESDSFTIRERAVGKGKTATLKSSKDFWYADSNFRKNEDEEASSSKYTPLGQRAWFRTLLWVIIIGAFAATLIWYLYQGNVRLFRKRGLATEQEGDEELPQDIFAINYQREIDNAVSQGNYRLAIRLHFLRLLKNLSDKGIIRYKQDRTNLDYLIQLNESSYFKSFFRLTRHYEYSWYGHFEVDKPAYDLIRSEFETLENQLQPTPA